MKKLDWEKFEQYIVEKLKEIDPYCSRTPGSGNKNIKGDIYFSKPIPLHIEAKQRGTKDITIRMDVWDKLKGEIPFYLNRTPVLALENKDKRRFAVLELDDFIELFLKLYKLENNEN